MLFQITIHQILMLRHTGRKLALYLMKMKILDIAIIKISTHDLAVSLWKC